MHIIQCPSLALQACCKRLPRHRLHSPRRSICACRTNRARYEDRETFGPAVGGVGRPTPSKVHATKSGRPSVLWWAGSGDPRPTVVDCRHQVVVLMSGRVAGGSTSVIARTNSAAMSDHVRRRNCSANGTVRRR